MSKENIKLFNLILLRINDNKVDYHFTLKFYMPKYGSTKIEKLNNECLNILALKLGIYNPEDYKIPKLKSLVKILLKDVKNEIFVKILQGEEVNKTYLPLFSRGELEVMNKSELNIIFNLYNCTDIDDLIEKQLNTDEIVSEKNIIYNLPPLIHLNKMIDDNFVDENGQINIDHIQFKIMIKKYGIDDLMYTILWNRKNGFPYKRYDMDPIEIFNNLKLKQYNIEVKHISNLKFYPKFFRFKKDTFTTFISSYDDYNINKLSDYFIEKNRIWCHVNRRNTQIPSIGDYWHKDILKWSWYNKIPTDKGLNSTVLRESLYNVHGDKECNTFNLLFSRYIIGELGTRILDFSAGWGDRLLSVISHDDKIDYYVGVDPNTLNIPIYAEMVEFFTQEKCSIRSPNQNITNNLEIDKYHIINYPFEDAPLPNGKTYNLVFTSPPFFTFEIYSDEPTQSVKRYNNFIVWVTKFLFTCIIKSINVLERGGYLALYISDVYGYYYVEPTLLFIEGYITGMKFKEVICYNSGENNKNNRPLWIWEKSGGNELNIEYQKALQKYYPNIHNSIANIKMP